MESMCGQHSYINNSDNSYDVHCMPGGMCIYSLILTNTLRNIIIPILQKRKLSIKRLKDLLRNTELEVAE